MLDEDTKRIITDACSEGRFDDAVAILTAAITKSAFVFHSNFINDISWIDIQPVPAAMRFAESTSSNRYLQAEAGADLPALLLNARSVKLSIAGCIIGPNCVGISVNSEGDVIVAIQNARIEDGLAPKNAIWPTLPGVRPTFREIDTVIDDGARTVKEIGQRLDDTISTKGKP